LADPTDGNTQSKQMIEVDAISAHQEGVDVHRSSHCNGRDVCLGEALSPLDPRQTPGTLAAVSDRVALWDAPRTASTPAETGRPKLEQRKDRHETDQAILLVEISHPLSSSNYPPGLTAVRGTDLNVARPQPRCIEDIGPA